MLLVVPAHERHHPLARLFDALEPGRRIARPILARAEQGLGEGPKIGGSARESSACTQAGLARYTSSKLRSRFSMLTNQTTMARHALIAGFIPILASDDVN